MNDLWFGTSGPRDAQIVVVGESWGASEAYEKKPLVGSSGQEFDRILLEAGIRRDEVFCTNCFAAQPQGNEVWKFFEPDKGQPKWRGLHPTTWAISEVERMWSQIRTIKPSLVIALGNYALWALTEGLISFGRESTGTGATVIVPTGITSWRGSMLMSDAVVGMSNLKVLPVLHPAAILRQWSLRAVTVHDLRTRVPLALSGDWRPTPPPNILSTPTFDEACRVLDNWFFRAAAGSLLRLSHDIETARGVITCMAFADGPFATGSTALVIPLVRPHSDRSFESYWSLDEEAALFRKLTRLWTFPNIRIEGQNYNYDTQWIEHWYGTTPNLDFDTMLAHHLLWPGTPKALDYLASLYNHYYWYWKDDNKEWDLKGNWEQHLRYNAEDALRTFECATELRAQIKAQGFSELWEIEKQKNTLALDMMRRGIRIDRQRRAEMGFELSFESQRIAEWLLSISPQSVVAPYVGKSSKALWPSSPAQQKTLFYDLLGLSGQRNRKTGSMTMNDEALENLKSKYPEFTRIWSALASLRSINVFHKTFISAELEPDGRMKCSFNTAGTETFRWSSSANAFWRGTNLQNIPKGEED